MGCDYTLVYINNNNKLDSLSLVSLKDVVETINSLKYKLSDYQDKFRLFCKGNFIYKSMLSDILEYVETPPEWFHRGFVGYKKYVLVIGRPYLLSHSNLTSKGVADKLNSYCLSFDDYDHMVRIFSNNEYIEKDDFTKLFKKESKKEWKVV
jgi:hypothetical protein